MSKFPANTYILPTLQALLLHAVVLMLFLSSWNVAKDLEEKTLTPKIVKATITSFDPIAARQKAEEEKKRKAAAAKRAAEKKRQAEAKRKRELAKRKEAERKKADAKKKREQQRLAEKKRKAEQERKAQAKRKRIEAEQLAKKKKEEELARQLERERELEIARALDEESEYLQYQSDAEEAMAYVGLIQERVIQNWHRPLSARKDMQAILMIHLVPTGEVHNVYVIEGSGDAAFDRSAILAVQRAEKFEELQNLPPRVFDAHFRQFKMIFKPEDLDR